MTHIETPRKLNLKELIENLNKVLKEHGDIHVAFYNRCEEAISIPTQYTSFNVYNTTEEAIQNTYTKDDNWIERAVYHKEWDKDSKVLVVR